MFYENIQPQTLTDLTNFIDKSIESLDYLNLNANKNQSINEYLNKIAKLRIANLLNAKHNSTHNINKTSLNNINCKYKGKIFGIGMYKTGTTSLKEGLQILGYQCKNPCCKFQRLQNTNITDYFNVNSSFHIYFSWYCTFSYSQQTFFKRCFFNLLGMF